MERRKTASGKSSPLPADFLKMVAQVFATNFDAGLKGLKKATGQDSHFEATGEVFTDEIVLCISLMQEGQLAATSVYASSDFDPKASSPTVEDLLGISVDAIGSVFQSLFESKDEDGLERLASGSLSALENVPFEWTKTEVQKRKLFLKIDKANPAMDKMADDFLEKNDPDFKRRQAEEQEETENLFVTGPKPPKNSGGKGGGSHTVH